MDRQKMWQIYHGDKQCPCYITDRDTFECLYANDEFFRVYKVSRDIIGSNFYDYLPLIENHLEAKLPDWETQDYYETDTYSTRLNRRFFLRAVLDRQANTVFCETIPTESDVVANLEFEKAMTRCVEIFDKQKEGKETLTELSALMAEFYHSEVAYVYHFDQISEKVVCVAHYTAPDYKSNGGSTTLAGMASIIDWFQDKNTPTIVMGDLENEPENIHPTLLDIIQTFGVRNIAFHKVQDGKGNFIGVVGVTNRRNPDALFDRRLIATIARFVAQDVVNGLGESTFFQQSNRDMMTGLYNRFTYDKKVTAINDVPPKTLGVISVNINGLKNINNNLGNEAGDQHIIKSGHAIKSHFGYDIFRVSGDEFIGLAVDVDKEEFEYKVSTLQTKLREEQNYDFSMGSSWGQGNYSYTNLLHEADNVMYINKQEYYALGVRTLESVSSVILRDLLRFLADEEFMIYLQPQVRLEDGSLHGAEALIRRFDKKNKKMVFPDQFISMYEQASVIRHIDLFVVDTVCQLLAQWQKQEKTFPISVNLSRVTLQEFGIVDTIVKICDKYHVTHALLVIEVTERVGLIENDVPSALVTEFIENGFTISLDDFGCAYSNIVTLAQIEVDEVKLDKSLVDNLTTNRKNHILVKNVLSMCEELEGMSTLAEGIEDKEQSNLLHELGCHLGQGYFYSRPMPVDEFCKKYVEGKEVVL